MAPWLRTVSFERSAGGAQAAYWETAWAEEKHEAPPWLLQALEPLLEGRARALESGCGQGEFVRLLRTTDREVVGVDLAAQALARSHAEHPDLVLAVADVSRLPFAPGSFDAIISLGVIEHFEGGPGAVLASHREVLAPDGVLLLTVPYRSLSRVLADWWHLAIRRRSEYRQRTRIVSRRQGFSPTPTPTFHQYEPSQAQLRRWLDDAGFTVTRWSAHDPGTAITETKVMARLLGRSGPASSHDAPPPTGHASDSSSSSTRRGDWIRSAAFGVEAPRGPIERAVRTAVSRTFGHMQLVVAVPTPQPTHG